MLRRPVGQSQGQLFAVGEFTAMEIGLNHSYSSFQVRPSRSIKATDALGPHVPAAYGRGGSPDCAQALRMGSMNFHAASTSSRRMNKRGIAAKRIHEQPFIRVGGSDPEGFGEAHV